MIELFPFLRHITFAVGIVLAGWLGIRRLTGALQQADVVGALAFGCVSVVALAWEFATIFSVNALRVGVLAGWVTSALIARQVAAWILVAPTVDHERMERWRSNLPAVLPSRLSRDCPELLTYTVSPILLVAAWLLTWWILLVLGISTCLWPVIFALSIQATWLVWHITAMPFVPFPNPEEATRASLNAIIVFLTYDIHRTPAAGVFRFPTRALRSPWSRWALFIGTGLAIGLTLGAACPNPFQVWYHGGSYAVQAFANLLTVCLAGPVALCSILFLSAGTLLARFERELLHHKDDKTTDWDNYIDRIINSNDDLEREHLFYGASERGDNPVLVHRDIQDQHVHVVGDSGANKTALGMAPQATQLIARGDSTVVIVDLKGDRALFEGCRREAARTRNMRFRWLSNEVGTTTFGFNPLTQSHNQHLSVEQLTQELLQGLSLDYGIQYGAGYFTAMNEIVLNSVLVATGDRSFGELSEHLSDREWYEEIGYKEDWKQARHLMALVKRLSASPAINVTPGMFSDQPEVHDDAIDAANLFQEPQVVYLWLKSAIEPTNAPAIARLFLWTLFTAASHQPADRNRVYFFIDEMQQVLSEGIKLIFEQFRDMGGSIIGAHQTAGQLRRQGADLGDTVDSCSAVKQVFRASDLDSLERLTKMSGTQRVMEANWYQPFEPGSGDLADRYAEQYANDGIVRVGQQKRERYDREALQALSARRLSSLVRFTFDSGYTQFSGKSIAISSPYHIHLHEYLNRRRQSWPTAPGAFPIEQPEATQPSPAASESSEDVDIGDEFGDEFEMRGRNQ